MDGGDGSSGPDGEESDLERLALAATAVADSTEGMDPDVVSDAAHYAHEEAGTGRVRYRTLLADVAGSAFRERDGDDATGRPNVDRDTDDEAEAAGSEAEDVEADPDRRAVAYARLRDHVERRRSRENDVEGLFE